MHSNLRSSSGPSQNQLWQTPHNWKLLFPAIKHTSEDITLMRAYDLVKEKPSSIHRDLCYQLIQSIMQTNRSKLLERGGVINIGNGNYKSLCKLRVRITNFERLGNKFTNINTNNTGILFKECTLKTISFGGYIGRHMMECSSDFLISDTTRESRSFLVSELGRVA